MSADQFSNHQQFRKPAIASTGGIVAAQSRQTTPGKFACPSAVLRADRTNHGATDTFQPWADAVAENA